MFLKLLVGSQFSLLNHHNDPMLVATTKISKNNPEWTIKE